MVTVGSKWTGGNRSFVVTAREEKDNETWIHYRVTDPNANPKEFSCFEQAFVSRFIQDHTQ